MAPVIIIQLKLYSITSYSLRAAKRRGRAIDTRWHFNIKTWWDYVSPSRGRGTVLNWTQIRAAGPNPLLNRFVWTQLVPHRVFNKSLLHLSDSAFRVLLTQVYEKCTNSAIPETRGSGAWLRFSDRLIIKLKWCTIGSVKVCKRGFPDPRREAY